MPTTCMSIITHLQTCTTLSHLKSIHAALIKTSPTTPFSTNQLIAASSRLHHPDYALLLFTHLLHPNTFVYNALIAALARSPSPLTALRYYSQMRLSYLPPTSYTFSSLIKAATASLADVPTGRTLHGQVRKVGFHTDLFVQTALIDFYSNSDSITESRKLFDEMPHPDTFTYATMITAHTRRGDMASAGHLFDEMPVRSTAAWNAMIVGYAKAGEVDRAGELFEQMPVKDLVSWTSMISCYSQSRRFRDAVEVFYMMIESDVSPDRVTMAAVIAACAHLGALDIGIELHHYSMFAGFEPDVYIGSALVDMYAKCGSIERALVVFFKLREKNLFCWNAVIEGLAMHGRGEEAMDMFGRMKREGIQPNWVSFVSVLGACTHAGLVEEGRRMFASMADEYSLAPRMEHYGCMVDLLGRGGFLQEALELIEKMPMEANVAVWGALLGACKIHENLKIGKIAGERLMVLEPDNSGYYLLLVNMYGGAKRWGETAAMREVMNWRGVEKKSPGCSWIQMDGVVHEFAATDTSHTAVDEICFLLLGLDGQLKLAGYVQESEHSKGFGD